MALSLQFTLDPPTPYHTLRFHMNQGIKKQLFKAEISGQRLPGILTELATGLKMLTRFHDDYAVLVLPSRIYAYSILQHIFLHGTLIVPVQSGMPVPTVEIMDSGIGIKSVSPGKFLEITGQLNGSYVVCRDTDPGSGFHLKLQDILTMKEHHPEMHVNLDLSFSFMNHSLNLENIDACFFDTRYVTGMHPSITIMIIRKNPYNAILENLSGNFSFAVPESGIDQPRLLLHREVDVLNLYVLKEICHDLVRRGPGIIRNEIIYKSIVLYQALEQSHLFKLVVNDSEYRSPNILTAQPLSDPEHIRSFLEKKGIVFDQIQNGKNEFVARFANYPVHSKEQVEFLADTLVSMNKS